MIDEMLTFLARAPTLGDLSLTWGQAGPRLGTDTALQNARRLAALQAWVAAESAAGRAPRLGNCEPLTEQVRTEGGQLDRADPGGTALYSIRVMAEYTMRYDA